MTGLDFITLEDFKRIAIPWNQFSGTYVRAGEVQWQKWLNGFLVENTGTTWLYFAGALILPGASKSYGGNRAEIYRGRLDYRFLTQTPAPGTITNQVQITQKFYLLPE